MHAQASSLPAVAVGGPRRHDPLRGPAVLFALDRMGKGPVGLSDAEYCPVRIAVDGDRAKPPSVAHSRDARGNLFALCDEDVLGETG